MAGVNTSWEDVGLRIFVDGEEKGLYAATRFSFNADVQMRSAKYQGQATPSKDGTLNGWSGSATFELRQNFANPMDVLQSYIQGIRDRTNSGRIRIIASHVLPSGSTEAMRFENCQLSGGYDDGEGERTKFNLSFEAEDGVPA